MKNTRHQAIYTNLSVLLIKKASIFLNTYKEKRPAENMPMYFVWVTGTEVCSLYLLTFRFIFNEPALLFTEKVRFLCKISHREIIGS